MFKKIIKYGLSILSTLFIIIALSIIVLGIIARKNNKMINIFGYSYSVVATNSMEPTIEVGEIIISKQVDYKEVKVEDIVVFYSSKYKVYFVHRVIDIDENGYLITKGDNPEANVDELPVTEDNYFGIVIKYGNILNVGNLVLKHKGIIFGIIILLLFYIIISEIIVLSKQIKEENIKEENIKEELKKPIDK